MTPKNTQLLLQALLHTLGRHSSQADLLEALRQCGMDGVELLRQGPVRPYPVIWPQAGLAVLMQHIKSDTEPQKHTWGLHSITLEAGRWPGPWPKGFNPDTVTVDDLVSLLAQDKAQALCTPEMVCLTTALMEGQTWSAVALFDPVSGKLQNLTLARQGEWIDASPQQPEPVAEETQPSAEPITCFSGGTVPMTGWYEGLLPPEHPSHASLSQLDARFVHREAGQRMSQLGVQPSRDEALVVWTWIGEELPKMGKTTRG